jgi:3-hydroxyacyl-[acyl-carrier-protein] dehydratase
MELTLPLQKEDIIKILPHRDPFLFVDSVIEIVPDKRIVGTKRFNEHEFSLRTPAGERPMVPAAILTEAMAQVGAILILSKKENRGKFIYFMGIEKIRFRKPVFVGQEIRMTAEVEKLRQKIGMLSGAATVDGVTVADGLMKFAFRD